MFKSVNFFLIQTKKNILRQRRRHLTVAGHRAVDRDQPEKMTGVLERSQTLSLSRTQRREKEKRKNEVQNRFSAFYKLREPVWFTWTGPVFIWFSSFPSHPLDLFLLSDPMVFVASLAYYSMP